MTADGFFELPDDGRRYELVDGEVEMAAAPSVNAHQYTVGRLFLVVGPHVEELRLGFVFVAPGDVVLSAYDVLQPDLFFIAAARSFIIGDRVHGAPDLVVEVISPSTEEFDRGLKLRRYARFGVAWYWIVDPRKRLLDEFELVDSAYVRRAHLEGDATFEPAIFPGLTINLARIWPGIIEGAPED